MKAAETVFALPHYAKINTMFTKEEFKRSIKYWLFAVCLITALYFFS